MIRRSDIAVAVNDGDLHGKLAVEADGLVILIRKNRMLQGYELSDTQNATIADLNLESRGIGFRVSVAVEDTEHLIVRFAHNQRDGLSGRCHQAGGRIVDDQFDVGRRPVVIGADEDIDIDHWSRCGLLDAKVRGLVGDDGSEGSLLHAVIDVDIHDRNVVFHGDGEGPGGETRKRVTVEVGDVDDGREVDGRNRDAFLASEQGKLGISLASPGVIVVNVIKLFLKFEIPGAVSLDAQHEDCLPAFAGSGRQGVGHTVAVAVGHGIDKLHAIGKERRQFGGVRHKTEASGTVGAKGNEAGQRAGRSGRLGAGTADGDAVELEIVDEEIGIDTGIAGVHCAEPDFESAGGGCGVRVRGPAGRTVGTDHGDIGQFDNLPVKGDKTEIIV